jgi:hypothetical protein
MSETPDSQQSHAPEPEDDQPYLHRLLSWRVIRRWLFAVICLATLIGLFYAVEDWRGRRAWEKCRRELEAKGAVLDWNAFIPPSVPDDQNIFKAPKMAEWFVRASWTEALSQGQARSRNATAPFSMLPPQNNDRGSLVVAEVDVVLSDRPMPPEKADAVLPFGEPSARSQAAKLLLEKIGPCAEGPTACGLIARPLDEIHAVSLVVKANAMPTTAELADFLSSGLSHFQAAPAGSNAFRISLRGPVYNAGDYLARSQAAVTDLDLLREAVKRPCARMDSDYQRPYERPIPNFVRMRTVAQILAQRAQCYLLLGQPEAAWHELALVRWMCHMLEAKPAGDCPTLVETMIDVAITGLYTSIIQDGLRLRVWREPELVAMQQQLAQINFLPLFHRSFEAERAATCRTFESTPPGELKKLFAIGRSNQGLWDKLQDPTYLLLTFAPRGWTYQNMCAGAPQEQTMLEALDLPTNQVLPGKLEGIEKKLVAFHARRSPYTFLAAIAIPNFVKATQTMARNQTLANEAYVACGLERYRLAHEQYPEALDALVPQFAAKLPHDIIGGEALKYERTADGGFKLYSIGWNAKDDGGVSGKTVTEGDWVWQ